MYPLGGSLKKTLLSEWFCDFQGGMNPRTSLDIELFCGTIDYALPEEVPEEIGGYNIEDNEGDLIRNPDHFNPDRYHLTAGRRICLGYGNYRYHSWTGYAAYYVSDEDNR
jgi:hypothetical protein